MRRTDILNSVNEVLQALEQSNVYNIFNELELKAQKEGSPNVVLLSSLKKYAILASKFSDNGKKIANIFKIDELENTEFWPLVLYLDSQEAHEYFLNMRGTLRFTVSYLPSILKLLTQETLRPFISDDIQAQEYKGKSLLSVIILEEEGSLSSPERLKDVLESVTLLYDAFSRIEGLPTGTLAVAACDSGSDKSFDFLGVAKVMECIKEIVFSVWDRVLFFREHQLSKRMSLVVEALPIIDQIGDLEKDKKLSREEAEIIRRNITNGVNKFISSGAIIPEIEERAHYNPRELMAPEPKLLTSIDEDAQKEDSISDTADTEHVDPTDLNNLEPNEQKIFQRLLKKIKTKISPDQSKSEPKKDVEDTEL